MKPFRSRKPFFRILQRSLYPALLVILTGVLFWTEGAVLPGYVAIVVAIALGMILERVLPFQREWNKPQGDSMTDFWFLILQPFLAPLIAFAVTAAVAYALPPLRLPSVRAAGISLWIQVLIGLVLSGLIPYWLHRLAHENAGLLWRAHSVHHAPERLYWMNAFRFHPINIGWHVAGSLLPGLLLGLDSRAIFIVGMLNNFAGVYNHMNIDFKLGFMNWILNTNELHRWHHSNISIESNSNYSGGMLSIWDVVFRTRFLPERKMKAKSLGLFDASTYPAQSFSKQLVYPLCECKSS
ncbi:MAG: sterol desaturase family protein [Spirochaetia bacterium]|nr:sterol desaturase family protein [Spirochaetia bacterium]